MACYAKRWAQHIGILVAATALIALVPVNTDVSSSHILLMGFVLAAVVAGPYAINRYVLKDGAIKLQFWLGRRINKIELAYMFCVALLAYLILPPYLYSTDSYLYWSVVLDANHITRLFVGTNALGIWDELFFVGVCLALLSRHIPFWWANVAQSVMWTAFLYELGFQEQVAL